MKGGWAGAKVTSAREDEPGCARRTPVTSRRYGGERPHPRGNPRGGGGVTGAAAIGAQSASFPRRAEPHHAEGPAHARPNAPRGTRSF